MAVPTKGSNVTVHIPTAVVTDFNPTQDHILVTLPGASGTQYWIPLNNPNVQVTQSLPSGWPPVEGDVWSVTTAPTVEAFVVSDGQGHLFFVLPQDVRNAYSGNTTPPITTDQALAQFGTALTLLFRKT